MWTEFSFNIFQYTIETGGVHILKSIIQQKRRPWMIVHLKRPSSELCHPLLHLYRQWTPRTPWFSLIDFEIHILFRIFFTLSDLSSGPILAFSGEADSSARCMTLNHDIVKDMTNFGINNLLYIWLEDTQVKSKNHCNMSHITGYGASSVHFNNCKSQM